MATPAADVERRAQRARLLAGRMPRSAEPLTFYAQLVALQHDIATEHPRVLRLPSSFPAALDSEAAADALPSFLKRLQPFAPAATAGAARALLESSHPEWRHLMHTCWAGRRDDDPLRGFLAEAFLQPFAEWAARAASGDDHAATPDRQPGAGHSRDTGNAGSRPRDSDVGVWGSGIGRDSKAAAAEAAARSVGTAFRQTTASGSHEAVCRVCGDRPVVALLREESHGARRSLLCGFCATEWPAPRLACLQCGEQTFEQLPVYRAEELPGVRVDACEACRTYVKTIDLTQDGTAVPIVDDIASIALDFWARQQGYRRLRPNLLRL